MIIIITFMGTNNIRRISEKTKGKGDFRLYEAISKAGTKKSMAVETLIKLERNSRSPFLKTKYTIAALSTYKKAKGIHKMKNAALEKF